MPTAAKVQRWTDLLAALLRYRYGARFEQLARDVPGYAHDGGSAKDVERAKRTFERDKDELRAFGVPIETRLDREDGASFYVLAPGAFYLPYLVMLGAGARSTPKRVPREGYRALESLAFEPDELAAIGAAASRVRALGDRLLASDAESALRKLAFDLPLGALAAPDAGAVVTRDAGDPQALERLTDALLRRKTVSFEYHAIDRDERSERTVEPLGLVFVGSAWYLVARDREREAIRKFRVSRARDVRVNTRNPGTADFDVPAGFSLAEHAEARHPWELGDGAGVVAEVELRDTTGAAMAAGRLGEPVAGAPTRRRFVVRRPDAFVRWLLSFAGAAMPVSPPALVADFRAQAELVIARHAAGEHP